MFDLVSIQSSLSKSAEYSSMLAIISQELPVIKDASANFGKTQSQFMDNMMTVSHSTPLRNARQILAEITRITAALRDSQYSTGKKKLLIQRLESKIENNHYADALEKQELMLERDYEMACLEDSNIYIEGAIRSLSNYVEQYRAIMKNNDCGTMTEAAFEKEEEQYHIMKAFDQALCAARPRGGLIDEGNHIYLSQIGINGGLAQNYVSLFLEQEHKAILAGGIPDAKFLHDFLTEMAKVFSGCSQRVASIKKMKYGTETAILK